MDKLGTIATLVVAVLIALGGCSYWIWDKLTHF